MFKVKEFPVRIFDETGDYVGWDICELEILEGVTLNGTDIMPDDFDDNGRLIIL